jgi:hypothetical protein
MNARFFRNAFASQSRQYDRQDSEMYSFQDRRRRDKKRPHERMTRSQPASSTTSIEWDPAKFEQMLLTEIFDEVQEALLDSLHLIRSTEAPFVNIPQYEPTLTGPLLMEVMAEDVEAIFYDVVRCNLWPLAMCDEIDEFFSRQLKLLTSKFNFKNKKPKAIDSEALPTPTHRWGPFSSLTSRSLRTYTKAHNRNELNHLEQRPERALLDHVADVHDVPVESHLREYRAVGRDDIVGWKSRQGRSKEWRRCPTKCVKTRRQAAREDSGERRCCQKLRSQRRTISMVPVAMLKGCSDFRQEPSVDRMTPRRGSRQGKLSRLRAYIADEIEYMESDE